MLATITAAVDVHCGRDCAERSRISTPPGNPRTCPSSIYLTQQLPTPAVFQQHADDGHSCHSISRSPEFIQHHTEPPPGCTARKRPLESELNDRHVSPGPTCKLPHVVLRPLMLLKKGLNGTHGDLMRAMKYAKHRNDTAVA